MKLDVQWSVHQQCCLSNFSSPYLVSVGESSYYVCDIFIGCRNQYLFIQLLFPLPGDGWWKFFQLFQCPALEECLSVWAFCYYQRSSTAASAPSPRPSPSATSSLEASLSAGIAWWNPPSWYLLGIHKFCASASPLGTSWYLLHANYDLVSNTLGIN